MNGVELHGVRAVVFDFDGLILDTETPVYASWCGAFADFGCEPPTLAEWATEVGGQGRLDVIDMLRTRAAVEIDLDVVQARRRMRRDELLEAETVLPGVTDWLAEAHALRLGVAVASSSEIEWVERHLERLGLRHHFSHVACWSEELRAKPEPDTYLSACAALGVDPCHALAVEDSANGVAAAKAAGMQVVAVPNAVTAAMDFSPADLVLGSLALRTLADVLGTR